MQLGNGPPLEVRQARQRAATAIAYNREKWLWYQKRWGFRGDAKARFLAESRSGWPLYRLWQMEQARKLEPSAEEKAQAIVDALMAKQKALEAEAAAKEPVTTPPDARTIITPPPAPPVTATLPVDSAPPGVPRSLIDRYRTQRTVYAGAPSPMTAAVATQAPPTGKKKGAGFGALLAIGIPAALMMFAG